MLSSVSVDSTELCWWWDSSQWPLNDTTLAAEGPPQTKSSVATRWQNVVVGHVWTCDPQLSYIYSIVLRYRHAQQCACDSAPRRSTLLIPTFIRFVIWPLVPWRPYSKGPKWVLCLSVSTTCNYISLLDRS